MSVIDFHSHILPGIDDGSRNVETSIGMLRMCREQGVDIMIATPHFYSLRSYAMRSILFRLDPTHRLWLMSELRLKTAVLYGGQE